MRKEGGLLISFFGFQILMLPGLVTDLKTGKVSTGHIIASGAAGLIMHLLVKDTELTELIFGIGLGLILLLMSVLSKDSFGKGDSLMMISAGGLTGFGTAISLLLVSLFMAALTGLILMACGKKKLKDRLPLAPFFYVAGTFLTGLSLAAL